MLARSALTRPPTDGRADVCSMLALSTLKGRDSLLSPHMLLGAMARTEASVSIERRRRLDEEARVKMEALSL